MLRLKFNWWLFFMFLGKLKCAIVNFVHWKSFHFSFTFPGFRLKMHCAFFNYCFLFRISDFVGFSRFILNIFGFPTKKSVKIHKWKISCYHPVTWFLSRTMKIYEFFVKCPTASSIMITWRFWIDDLTFFFYVNLFIANKYILFCWTTWVFIIGLNKHLKATALHIHAALWHNMKIIKYHT